MLDRTVAPAYQKIKNIDFVKAKTQKLSNGVPLHIISAGEQELLKVELIFKAGNWFNEVKGQAFFTSKMLFEGTKTHTGYQISEQIDQYGGYLDMSSGFDRLQIGVFIPARYLSQILEIIKEIILEASFPENELETIKKNYLQDLEIDMQKDAYLATRAFREQLFGKKYPYTGNIKKEDIEKLDRDLLVAFYEKYVHLGNCEIILTGNITDKEIAAIDAILGKISTETKGIEVPKHSIETDLTEIHIERPDSVQSAVRMGKILFNGHHPDHIKILVTNEIFGGYFGSRLMQNIREDKGYTYGIYSQIVHLEQLSYLYIATDVKKEFTKETIFEIKKEIEILQNTLVDESELELVKNYIIGELVASITTVFEQGTLFKSIYFSGLSYEYYDHYLANINAVTAQDVQEMAKKYLNPDTLLTVVAGGK